MPTPFSIVKHFLSLVLAGSVTYSFVSGFSPVSIVILVSVVVVFAYWLLSHKHELGVEYSSTEGLAAIPGKYDAQIWGNKPRVRDLAPGLVVFGLAGFYLAYLAIDDVPKDGFRSFVYQSFGATGVVAVMSLIASICFVRGIELWLGFHTKKSNAA